LWEEEADGEKTKKWVVVVAVIITGERMSW
jgi:hypothetical protein